MRPCEQKPLPWPCGSPAKDAGRSICGKLLEDAQPAVRQAALNGLIDLQDSRSLREILAGDKVDAKLQGAGRRSPDGSTGGALVLLRMLDEKRLSPALAKQTLAKATSHPDANVRVLYEKYIPEDQRPQRLGSAIKAGRDPGADGRREARREDLLPELGRPVQELPRRERRRGRRWGRT